MDLSQFVFVLRLRWRQILTTVALAFGIAAVTTAVTTPLYVATARLVVPQHSTDAYPWVQMSPERMSSYVDYANGAALRERAFDRADVAANEHGAGVIASASDDVTSIGIRGWAADPKDAAALANALAVELATGADRLEGVTSKDDEVHLVAIAARAVEPRHPTLPSGRLNSVIAGAIGLLVGIGGALIREAIDHTVRGRRDVEEIIGQHLSTIVPFDPDVSRGVPAPADGPLAEAVRVLRTQLNRRHEWRTLVVTSPRAAEGKSTVAAALAASLAATNKRVLLVDADLRRPTVAQRLGLDNSVGLMDVLSGQSNIEDVIQKHRSRIDVIGSGPLPSHPDEVLTTEAMRHFVELLAIEYDHVIIDAPPALPVADASLLAPLADGTVLITRAGTSTPDDVELTLTRLGNAGAKVIGSVLNEGPRRVAGPTEAVAGVPISGGIVATVRHMWFSLAWIAGALLLLPLALGNLIVAGALAGLAAFVVVLGTLGRRRTAALALVLAFLTAPMYSLAVPGASLVTVSDLFFVVAISLSVDRLFRKHHELPVVFIVGAMVFVMIGLIAALRAEDIGFSYSYLARIIAANILVPLLIVWWWPSLRLACGLVAAYMGGTAISIIYGLVDPIGPRNQGLTEHPNGLGYTALLSIVMIPHLFANSTAAVRRVLVLGALPIAAFGIWTSGSRAALLVMLVIAVAVPLLERSVVVGVLLGIVAMVGIEFVLRAADSDEENALTRLLGKHGSGGSTRAREESFSEFFHLFTDNPVFGIGFDFHIFAGHNAYLQIAAAAGAIGLLGFLLIVGSMLPPLVARGGHWRRLAYVPLAFLIAAPVSPNLTDRYIALPMGLALLAAVHNRIGTPTESDESPEHSESEPTHA